MSQAAPLISINPPVLGEDWLKNHMLAWLQVYEQSRIDTGGDMRIVVEQNAGQLSKMAVGYFNPLLAATAISVARVAAEHGFAAGLGRPMPTVELLKPPAPPPKPHPSRAVQTVERNPETLEVTRTVTEYE